MSDRIELDGFFKRGSSWDISVARTADGAPVDLTGLTHRAMFRLGDETGEELFELTEGDGLTVADPASGTVSIRVSASRSASLDAGDTVCFDLEQTDPLDATFAWHSPTYFIVVAESVTRDG